MIRTSKRKKIIIAEACNWDYDVAFRLFKRRKRGTTYSTEFEKLNIDEMSDEQFEKFCRFEKQDIPRLVEGFRLPDKIICPDRTTATSFEAVLITLRRLVYPNRLCDLEPVFGRPSCALSQISNTTLDLIYDNIGHLLHTFDQPWLHDGLEDFAAAVSAQGAPLQSVWGFIDGTVRPICRPKENQEVCYNGHKRLHSLKYQSIACPNGLIANMFGPVEGRRHDSGLLRMSQITEQLSNIRINDTVGCIYGDPAYPLREYLQVPIRRPGTAAERNFNSKMSQSRICVEWVFGKILNNFAFLDYKKNQKLCKQAVGKMYLVAALLTNCHTCLYGSQTSDFFDCRPPTLEEYLQVE